MIYGVLGFISLEHAIALVETSALLIKMDSPLRSNAGILSGYGEFRKSVKT